MQPYLVVNYIQINREYPKVCRLTSLEVYFMARKKDSPQKAALRDMMSIILEGALD